MPSVNPGTVTARRIFDGEQFLEGHGLILNGEVIEAIVPAGQLPSDTAHCDLGDATLAPGLIDIQVNGGGGVMLNNAPCVESVIRMASAHRRFGTTGLAPTIISDTPEVLKAAAEAVSAARDGGAAEVLALHIEGPHFDMARRGTHKADMIRPLNSADMAWLCSLQSLPVILTLAPEHTQPGQLRALAEAGLLLCAGHTDASYERIQEALAEGLRGFTHLFNAMSPLASRAPGTVGAALDADNAWAGIIADGHHVHPAAIRAAHRAKAAGKLLLVSDAMATVDGPDSFEIYGETITVRNGALINAEGSLAGSAIALIDAVRISHHQVGLELSECLRMASLYPATFLKLDDQLGRLRPGYRADLVAFNEDFNVSDTWVAGQHQHHATTEPRT
ncbi:N-acetylglucosamine-6-phosphate deacetylase [Halioglobus maricola]|uniref:N-acetylglucosamine-6-phosphate deacetylase n=1 Tax=Halioglobus maricola TaxID=2601894 RepID=A0A5P9NLR1_9GAMM|nr:N-acetylglucosamine-6-phosphate deacetylase [Halioglobus maricola]QFU76803.1 N-acetylglucosamine-6-phosphate deacetylase [Halioglobus maricola]